MPSARRLRIRIVTFCVFLLISIGWLAHFIRPSGPETSAESVSPPAVIAQRGEAGPKPPTKAAELSAGVDSALEAEPTPAPQADAGAPSPPVAVDWVKRTIAMEWTDGPDKLVGRQRVRIVEADFKYPLLRIEEAVTVDPANDKEIVTFLRASVADHLLLGLKPGVDASRAASAVRAAGYQVRAIEPDSHLLAVLPRFEEAADHDLAAAELAALDEFINHAEPDYLVFPCAVPNDPGYSQGKLWGLHNPGTSADSIADADIDAPEGWAIRKDAPDVVVAVTDTGIQYTHEDLRDNLWTHPSNGSHGFDAYDDDNDPMDVGGHGTHCAGTIGAQGNNAKGLTGVAWEVQLMAVRFLGPNGGATSDAIRVVNYSRQNGAHIISASWGGGGFSQSLFDAIKACGDAGIPFVAAAGNSSANNDATPHYPSSYKLGNIVSVASTTKKDQLSTFSCYGKTSVDIGAPGSSIWSSYTGSNTSYTFLNGTSMATPHVSGALALAMAQFPGEEMTRLIDRLYDSTDKIPALVGKTTTGGRLNLARLLGGSPPGVSNDHFADAHRIEGHYGSWTGSNAGATREPDENQFSLVGIGNKSLWLAFHTAHRGLVSIDVANGQFDFEVVVFEGSEKGQLKVVAHSHRNEGFNREIRFTSKPGTEYRVVLDTYLTTPLRWEVDYTLAPPNDFFADATPLSGDLFVAQGYNRAATSELFERLRPHAARGRGKSAWWRWTAPFDGDFTINTSGSAFDTVLAVYTGENANALTEVASNDDRLPLDYSSQVSFSAVAGTTYHIAVDSCHENVFGDIALNGFRSNTLQIIRQPQDVRAALGKRAVFDVSALSATWVSYQWFFNGQAIPGQTWANLVIDPVRESDLGSYHVEVRNNENLVVSDPAVLSEAQVAPRLVWSSGNQAVASGTAVSFAANFSGSSPMTFAWTKNGQPYPGDSPSLSFASAQTADAGAYRLTATNSAGSATAEFTLSVVSSPWDRWEWRRPGVTNPEITDIMVSGTRAYAVAGNAILRSDDGQNWTKLLLPQGFYGKFIAVKDGTFICIGRNLDNQLRVAVSGNAVDWTVHQMTGDLQFGSNHKPSVFKSQFILADSRFAGQVYRSNDGIAWTRIEAPDYQDQVVTMSASNQPATNGDVVLIASSRTSNDGSIFFHRSSDGINWREFRVYPTNLVSASWSPSAIIHDSGVFKFFGSRLYTSGDGFDWQKSNLTTFTTYTDTMFARTSDDFYGFRPGSPMYDVMTAYGESKAIWPSSDSTYTFTAASKYGDKMIFGTNRGNLKLVSQISDVFFPPEPVSLLNSIEFIDGQFFSWISNNSGSIYDTVSNLSSGDGVNWKLANNIDTLSSAYIGKAYGKYWARTQSTLHNRMIGHNPFDARNDADLFGTTLEQPSHILEAEDGTALGVFSGVIQRRANAQSPWTTVSFPGTVSRLARVNGRWFTHTSTQTSHLLYTSTNGTTWTSTGITGSNAIFTQHQGVLYCHYQTGTKTPMRLRTSIDGGSSWLAEQTATGLPTTNQNIFAKRIFSFGGSLVMLPLPNSSNSINRVYFSNDGATWLEGSLPVPISDAAVGNGRIVAITTTGGIIESGTPHAGVNAPQVSIVSPQTMSAHLINSNVYIEGRISDPEDGSASYEAYLDGDLISSGVGTTFRFPVSVRSTKGHTVTVYAMDSQGLKAMDAIRLKVQGSQFTKLTNQYEGKTYIPSAHTAVLDGVFYAASGNSLHRSLDGHVWEPIPIPGATGNIQAIAAGNGSLVLQFSKGGIITTRDGLNWTHFQPNQVSYLLAEPLVFQNGLFTSTISKGGADSSFMYSENGLAWTVRTTTQSDRLTQVIIGSQGVVMGIRGNPAKVERSTNAGSSWQPVSAFPAGGSVGIRGIHAAGKFVILAPNMGKVLTSTDGYSWQEAAIPGNLGATATNLQAVDRTLFLGNASSLLFVSQDGLQWSPISQPIKPSIIARSQGRFVALGATSLVTSPDGIIWQPLTTPFAASSVVRILSSDRRFVVIDNRGATWVSLDADTWASSLPGATTPATETRVGNEVVSLNQRLVAGGAFLMTSADNGETWTSANIDGSPPPTTNFTTLRLEASHGRIIGVVNLSVTGLVISSVDGINFTTVSGLPAKTWRDVAWNGTEWMLLASDGTLYKSADDGASWTAVSSTTSLKKGGAIRWFGGKWVIIGNDNPVPNSSYFSFNLTAAGVFTKHSSVGISDSTTFHPFRTLVAHGKMFVFRNGEKFFFSTNGSTWTNPSAPINTTSKQYDIYSTADGFVAFIGATDSSPVYAVRSGTAALTWTEISLPFNGVREAHNLTDRLFVFSPGVISEIPPYDLALSIPNLASASLGVGDLLSASVTISNFGTAVPSNSRWAVRAWLSRTAVFKDGRDFPIGVFEITDSMPTAGNTKTIPLSFTIPNEIGTGSNYLILSLESIDGIREMNVPNNTAISERAAITIPEWEFSVATNGNGQVNRDFAAMRYPHKAQVSLTASAGKGATFTGWSGDAYSPNNQITILMDGHKSVAANFSNRAFLQVFMQGAGSVSGLAELGSYPVGTTAQLTAVPAPGWVFSRWSGASDATTAATSIVMNEADSVTAHFVLPLATWKGQKFTAGELADPAVSGDDADPDNDGVTNWREYLHGSHPKQAGSKGVSPVTLENGFMRVVYTRNLGAEGGATLVCEAARSLAAWNAPDLRERILSTVDGIESVEALLPLTGHETGFLRFRYDPPQP